MQYVLLFSSEMVTNAGLDISHPIFPTEGDFYASLRKASTHYNNGEPIDNSALYDAFRDNLNLRTIASSYIASPIRENLSVICSRGRNFANYNDIHASMEQVIPSTVLKDGELCQVAWLFPIGGWLKMLDDMGMQDELASELKAPGLFGERLVVEDVTIIHFRRASEIAQEYGLAVPDPDKFPLDICLCGFVFTFRARDQSV